MGVPITREIAKVRDRLMAAVQQAELHRLVRSHVRDDLHADLFQWRPAVAGLILEHPLLERFGNYRPGVEDPEALGHHGSISLRGLRRDAIDHSVREGD